MAKIRVHLLAFCSPGCTHTEIALENLEANGKSFVINRWEAPWPRFMDAKENIKQRINCASEDFQFEMNADPDDIVREWQYFYKQTDATASILTNNCGDAVEWFLTRFANIPADHKLAFPLTLNHLTFGIFIPSFLPIGITLPGRVFDNAQFYVSVQNGSHPGINTSSLCIGLAIAASAMAVVASIAAIVAASLFLSGIIAVAAIAAASVATLVAMHGLFQSINLQAAKDLHEKIKKQDDLRMSPLKTAEEGLLNKRTTFALARSA